jgi:hypothetical protein
MTNIHCDTKLINTIEEWSINKIDAVSFLQFLQWLQQWLQQSLDLKQLKAMIDSNGVANNINESHFN